MTESASTQYLRFGQIIRIHGHKCLQSEEDRDEIRGVVAVKGFTDKDAKYLTFNTFKDCEFYRKTLFQILPRGYFEPAYTQQQKISRLKDYRELVTRRMGEFVKFSEDVVFQHVDSHEYLSGSVRCSDGGLGAFKVQLSSELLINLVFKLYPFRSFEKEGDRIKLESPLRIKNLSNRCYISTEKNNQDRYNIVTTYSQKFTWLIHLHESPEALNDRDAIRTHDLLFLIHTKNEGYLTKDASMNPTIKLPLQDTGYPFFTSLWQIERYPVPEIFPKSQQRTHENLGTEGTYSLRKLLTGEYLEAARMSLTNFGNEVDMRQITIKSAKGLTNTKDYLRDNGLIKLGGPKSLHNDDGEIDAGINLEIEVESLVFRATSPFSITDICLQEMESEHGFRIMKIDDQSKDEVLFVLSTYEIFDHFVAMLSRPTEVFEQQVKSRDLEAIDMTLQKLIGFIKACTLEDIESQVLPNRKRQYICMDLKLCEKLFAMLRQIGNKILEQVYKRAKGENDALKKVYNRAYCLVWQIIKGNPITKIYVCEDWLDIILDHAIQNEEETVHATLNQILQNNDQVVTKFLRAKDNHLVQRIIDVFILKPPHEKFLNIFRASCVTGKLPIVANQNLILNSFIIRLDDTSRFRFLYDAEPPEEGDNREQIKRIYIQCAISKDHNAVRTLKLFFEESARLDLSQTANYFISYLNLLADICYGKNTEAKKYVEQSLVPNKRESEYYSSARPSSLDVLIAILEDKEMASSRDCVNLQRAVLRLITYAYVESADQNPVLRINRYRNLDRIMLGNGVDRSGEFDSVIRFIKEVLTNFKSFFALSLEGGGDKPEIIFDSIQRLYTIIELLKSTLINGMWSVTQQQNIILPLLLNILRNQKSDILHQRDDIDSPEAEQTEFAKFKLEVSKPTPAVQLIIKCKALACELIEIIFDFRFNNLVTETVSFYKDLEHENLEAIKDVHNISPSLLSKYESQTTPLLLCAQIWEEKMSKILAESSEEKADNMKGAINLLIPLMVQLSIHKNSRLLFCSLRILKRHFYSCNDIKEQLLRISLYDNRKGQYLAEFINRKRRTLNKLEEESLLYIRDDKSKPYNEIMKFLVWLSEAIKQGSDLQNEPNFENFHSIFSHFTEESRIDRFQQRLIKNTDLHPIMLRFLALSNQPLESFSSDAKLALKYVYRFLALLARNHSEAKKEMVGWISRVKTHAREDCCEDNLFPVDKLQLKSNLHDPLFLLHLQMRDDCEAIELLVELFTDNKALLFSEPEMETVTAEIAEMINCVTIRSYYKAHLLDFLRSLAYYKDKHIPVNKSRILAKLQDSEKDNIYYRFDLPMFNGLNDRRIEQLVVQWQTQNEQLMSLREPGKPYPIKDNQEQLLILMPELTYFVVMLNLLSNLVEGTHTVNIGKCRQVHQYLTLLSLLKDSSICYPLKTHLRAYINQLYYSTPIEEDLCANIIKHELPLLISDMNTLIVVLSKKLQGRYRIIHPIRYCFFDSYIYLYAEKLVATMNYLLCDSTFMLELKKELNDNYARGYYTLHYIILRIYERLRWLLGYYYRHSYVRGFLNRVTNHMKQILLIDFKDNAFRVFDRAEEKLHDPKDYSPTNIRQKTQLNQVRVKALKKRCTNLLYKLMEADIGNYFTEVRSEKDRNFPLTFCLPYDQHEAIEEEAPAITSGEQQKRIAEKLRIMLFSNRTANKKRIDYHNMQLAKLEDELSSSASFRLAMANAVWKECQQLYEIDKFSTEHYKFQSMFVSFQEYIRIFVEVNTHCPSDIPNDLKIFFLNVLLQYIVRCRGEPAQLSANAPADAQNPEADCTDPLKPIELWEKEDWLHCQPQVVQAQLFLKEANVSELLIETLKTTDDIELVLIALQFGIAYLLGGNTECQNSILSKLYEDHKNEVFLKLQRLITRLGRKITSRILENSGQQASNGFMAQTVDRYDYYDNEVQAMRRFGSISEERQNIEEQATEWKVFGAIFKFLQLLCECNNFAFKDFIVEQVDKDGTKKNYSFNILSMTTFQIRRLFKVMSKDVVKLVLSLTDFLNEVVTLPCINNQLSLCESTFFEDLCYMALHFQNINNLKEKGFDTIQNFQSLLELYQKCIQIVLNILQGNDPELNRAFQLKLDVRFLLNIIRYNLQSLGLRSRQDLRNMLSDPRRQRPNVPPELQCAINVKIVLLKLEEGCSDAYKERERQCYVEAEKQGLHLEELLHTLKEEILKIEVISSRGRQFIYFPKHPILTKLSNATRDRIMEEVSRSTQREKIKSLLQFKDEIFAEITHNFELQQESFVGLSINPTKIEQLKRWVFRLSYCIIIIWSFNADVIIEYGEVYYVTPKSISLYLTLLSILQLIATCLHFILYFKANYKLTQFRANQRKQKEMEEAERDRRTEKSKDKTGDQKLEMQAKHYTLRWLSNNPLVLMAGNDNEFTYSAILLLASLLGTFFDMRLFVLYVLFYFMRHNVLENVFKAITSNIRQLFSVSLLGLVFAYVFCLIFLERYAKETIGDVEDDPCQDIVGCVLDLYVSGNIGGSVDQFRISRFITDLIYFIFFGLLFGEIIRGIMIETFAQRRTQREEMHNDKKNKCYICGRERGQLQKQNEKFEEHITNKHFLWNYIYYLYCLYHKQITEYTGLEYEIRMCVDSEDNDEAEIKWIPFDSEKSNPHAEKIQQVTSQLGELTRQTKEKLSQQAVQSSQEDADK